MVLREQLRQRLHELHAELDAGQRSLAELDIRRQAVLDTMLRITGAIQVLEELMNDDEAQDAADDDAAEAGDEVARPNGNKLSGGSPEGTS